MHDYPLILRRNFCSTNHFSICSHALWNRRETANLDFGCEAQESQMSSPKSIAQFVGTHGQTSLPEKFSFINFAEKFITSKATKPGDP